MGALIGWSRNSCPCEPCSAWRADWKHLLESLPAMRWHPIPTRGFTVSWMMCQSREQLKRLFFFLRKKKEPHFSAMGRVSDKCRDVQSPRTTQTCLKLQVQVLAPLGTHFYFIFIIIYYYYIYIFLITQFHAKVLKPFIHDIVSLCVFPVG